MNLQLPEKLWILPCVFVDPWNIVIIIHHITMLITYVFAVKPISCHKYVSNIDF